MIELAGAPSPWVRSAASFALDVGLKATVLWTIAFVLHALVGRRRVLVRSVLWYGCIAGLLALPLGVLIVPQLRIACLPSDRSNVIDRVEGTETRLVDSPVSKISRETDAVQRRASEPSTLPVASAADGSVGSPPRGAVLRADPYAVAIGVYLAGTLCFFVRLVASLGAVARLRKSTIPVDDTRWTDTLDRSRSHLWIRYRVRLARSARTSLPLVVGWHRPMIVLPSGLVESASARTIEGVLLHELAHVRRGDYPWNLLLRLVQVVYWPHPLVWLMGRFVVAVREQACDDTCVFWMEDAMSYRSILLDVADGLLKRPREALGIGMARSSRLRRRIRDIEASEGTARCLLRGPVRVLIVAVVLAAAGVVGSIRLARTASAQNTEPAKKSDSSANDQQKAEDKAQEEGAAKAPADAPSDIQKEKKQSPFRFEAVKVRRGPVQVESTQQATLEFAETAEVYPPAGGGIVREITASVGERVKKGQLLARLDPFEQNEEGARARSAKLQATARQRQAEASLAVAQAALEVVEAKVAQSEVDVDQASASAQYHKKVEDRTKALFQKNAVPESTMDEVSEKRRAADAAISAAKAKLRVVKSEVVQARAEIAAAEAGLKAAVSVLQDADQDVARNARPSDPTKIVAPFDGIVIQRNASLGSAVRPGADTRPVFVVAPRNTLTVVSYVNEFQALLVDPGDLATFRPNSQYSSRIESKVSRVDYKLDPARRNLRVEFDIPNPDGKLRPGMSGWATIALEERPNVLQIPLTAVVSTRPSEYQCIRVEDGKAFLTRVELASQNNNVDMMLMARRSGGFRGGMGGMGLSQGSRSKPLDLEVTSGLKDGDSVLTLVRNGDGEGHVPDLSEVQFEPGQRIETIRLPDRLLLQ